MGAVKFNQVWINRFQEGSKTQFHNSEQTIKAIFPFLKKQFDFVVFR